MAEGGRSERDHDLALATIPDTMSEIASAVKAGGRLVSLVGPPDAGMLIDLGLPTLAAIPLGFILSRRARAEARQREVSYQSLYVRADGERLQKLCSRLEAGQIRPNVDKVYALDQASEALDYVQSGSASGKVVLQIH